MLLFSTTLHIKDTLTRDEFIKLVINWNQTSTHKDNVIPNIVWNGEYNIRYGNESLWMDIEEYRNKGIIAVRFEKREEDGAIWDTDYIMNFESMEMTIQLDRSYTEDAQMEDLKFSTPHFVSMLIEGGYLLDDNGLPVLRQEILITEENLSLITDVINGKSHYRLPIVYVTKTVDNHDPVSIGWLCSKLKGVAHVLLQAEKRTNKDIRSACNDNNEYFGWIGIYFPNGKHRRILYRSYACSENILLDKVTRTVLQYMNAQKKPLLSTWQGVNNSLLTDKYDSQKAERAEAERAREAAESEVERYIGAFDEDNNRLRQKIDSLTRANTSLSLENQGLRGKLSSIGEAPILFLGDEEEFYQGEIKEMILDAVAENLKNLDQTTRRWAVLNDVLQNNDYHKVSDERKNAVKKLFNGYKKLSASMRQQLGELGFVITEDGKHYRLTYYGDGRYNTTVSKTASDCREGTNIALEIIKNMM